MFSMTVCFAFRKFEFRNTNVPQFKKQLSSIVVKYIVCVYSCTDFQHQCEKMCAQEAFYPLISRSSRKPFVIVSAMTKTKVCCAHTKMDKLHMTNDISLLFLRVRFGGSESITDKGSFNTLK